MRAATPGSVPRIGRALRATAIAIALALATLTGGCGDGDAAAPTATAPATRTATSAVATRTPTPPPPTAPTTAPPTPTPPAAPTAVATRTPPAAASGGPITWINDGATWRPQGGTAPACPTPLVLSPPVDVGLATSVLYPGQLRGGNYKPHGGFRFDGLANDVPTVRSPITGVVWRGGRYLQSGEVQYLVDIVAPCGIMVRLDHLLTLAGPLAHAFDAFPPPTEGDSRTSVFSPPITVQAGGVLATAVGATIGPNVFVDFGVYDLRQPNAISADPAWAAAHGSATASYAVCWFDLLPSDAAQTVRALPAGDFVSGASSDCCTP